jgi:hypothetical protein
MGAKLQATGVRDTDRDRVRDRDKGKKATEEVHVQV